MAKTAPAAKKRKSVKTAGGKNGKAEAVEQGGQQQEHDLLTMPEAIDRLKTTRATFYRWLKAG